MKKILLALFSVLFVLINGCSDSATGSGTDPFGGGGGTGGVTFTVGQRQGNQGGIMFTAKPSTNIILTEFTCSLPAQPFSETHQGDGTTVYQGNQVYDLAEFTGVVSGQQWTFNFKGKIGSATGQDYNVNSNYPVP